MVRRLSRALDIVVAPAMLISLVLAFLYAPDEATMKSVYRIFFFHVPAAASSFVGFAIVFVCSILYLRTRKQMYDLLAGAAAEVGVVFCAVGIGMGMLWAKPVWGTYWIPGDVHLMTTAVLFLIYVSYLMLRASIEDDERRARLASVIGIFGFAGVPIVYFSIRVVQIGNHPVLLGLEPRMQLTFMVCMTSMLLFFTFILVRRVRLELARAEVARMRRDLLELAYPREATARVVAGAAVETQWNAPDLAPTSEVPS
ncbi:MAG TPA: cytochrome c biogenesis protein [Chloroflexota bacterium]|nr:cytochrome c biogenesis protein [Chloroflexota bacterium]